ncbi:S66 peptidase family protein [Chitinophaga nivalis]|uniref:LD-carboxypeptidase n=1 Tax=Chitinophaga nivalis TaxID=2991709 RepID=A0ABT3ISI1_9BACT|nr:LD-carboxypeptidase [Chitinophaga nivalis]MCW3463382.1 LD-carboxypeptidase [Chitinophaga nivalis]MCW3486928.1 LD-carboxypeptidase [Chitinophaga nivalis]
MNRKHFLSAMLTAGAGIPALQTLAAIGENATGSKDAILPPYLQPGDIIGITCPAGYIQREELQPAIRIMESWGFNIRIGKTVGLRDNSFAGTDQQRLQDMQAMLNDPHIKAIMCGRGGYGSARIIDQLDFTTFRRAPKWIIGFSDITVLHCHISRHFGIASLHAKMCNSFPDDFNKAEPVVQETILSIRQALTGKKMQYNATPDVNNRAGIASGLLIGGNLSMIQSIAATDSEIDTNGKILFLEEVGEYPYSLDRMLGNLQRSHKLDRLAGLIIGGFNRIKPDDPGEEFGKTIYEMVLEKTKDFRYPICFNFPVGHQKNNYALKCGVMHTLRVDTNKVTLQE